MNIQEVDVMTTFYCDRMEDEVSTKENIAGLTALQTMPGFGEEEVTKVCNAYCPSCDCSDDRLFNDVEMTRQLQPTRYAIFTLIDCMMKKQRKGQLILHPHFLMSSIEEIGQSVH
jgi:Dos2-interacting transcription regulator of RNA-Pol-II